MPSYYDLLGVTVDAEVDDIHRAYLRQAQRLHPDRYAGAPEAERLRAEADMKALNEAWNTLKNPDTRQRYDAELDEWWNDDDPWAEPAATRRSLFRRPGVRLAVVVLLVAGMAASAVGVFSFIADRPPPAARHTADSWPPSATADLRSAALRAGLDATEADCFVNWVTTRYRPSDQVDTSAVALALDSCR